MVVAQHALEGGEVELGVVLGVLSETDGVVLVDDASDLHHCAVLELLGAGLELNDFDGGL